MESRIRLRRSLCSSPLLSPLRMATKGHPLKLGNQPIGMQHGMGVNEASTRSNALIAEITSAVSAAKDGSASRRQIFNRFADRASKATVYRHIDMAIESTGAKLAPTRYRRQAAMTEAEQEVELHEVMPEVEAIARLAVRKVMAAEGAEEVDVDNVNDNRLPGPVAEQPQAPQEPIEARRRPPQKPEEAPRPYPSPVSAANSRRADLMVNADGEVVIDLSAGMSRALVRAEKLMEKAETEDGEIRNNRLMIVAIDLYGKTAERKARVDADLSDSSQQGAYLRAITNAVLAEPADVKARILARMRGVNVQWGM